MSEDSTTSRRSVLTIISASLLSLLALSGVATARTDGPGQSPRASAIGGDESASIEPSTNREPSGGTEPQSDGGFEIYDGVVDRIVDDQHVVILLEEDGELVDQIVEDAADIPFAEEGDELVVVFHDGEVSLIVPA